MQGRLVEWAPDIETVRWRGQVVQPEGPLLVAGDQNADAETVEGTQVRGKIQSGEPGLRTGQRQRTRCQPFQWPQRSVTGDQAGHCEARC